MRSIRGLATLGLVLGSMACAASTPTRGELRVLDLAAGALGLNRTVPLDSLEYRASGRYFQFGQAPAPELPWPEFAVDGYVATLDYARAAVHAKYHRVQVQEPGRARPHSEQTMDQYARDGVTWNLAPGPVAIPANLAERNAELWASPQGFVKAALANHAALKALGDGSMQVSFLVGPYRYEGELDRNHEVTRVRTCIDSPVLGDTPIEFRYSEYRDFDGIRFPTVIERQVAGLPWYRLTVSEVRINTAQPFEVPAEIAADPAPPVARIAVSELAPGVWLFGGGTHNSVIVEQRAGLLVIEAPLGDERSQAILSELRARFGARKILGVINTHVHFDHAGGLRAFVAAGIPVITQQRNATYFQAAWKQPHTLNPDRLAKSPRRARFRTFADRLLLEDAERPVEIHSITGSGHNDAFAMVYLPKQRLLVEGDAWTPTPPGANPPAVVNPLWLNLHDNLQRLHLDVERIAPLHGAVQTIDAFRAAIGLRAPGER
jgi:glyoxylase-like metal-dependent hydrolase (beta-lactamase superfamily II)